MLSINHQKLGFIASIITIIVLAGLVYLFLWFGGWIVKEETIIKKEIPNQVTPEIPREELKIIKPEKGKG